MESADNRRNRLERRSELLSRANRDAFDALRASLQIGHSIAVIGAGISVRAGYPTWGQLLTLLGEETLRLDPGLDGTVAQLSRVQDVLWRAERYRSMLGEDRYSEFLRKTFRPKPNAVAEATVKDLVRLNFAHFLTTNYDESLEQAHVTLSKEDPTFPPPDPPRVVDWMNPSDVREFMYELHGQNYGRRYVYLHGRYNNPPSIVLSDRDYTERYLRSSESNRKLFALLATQTLVFVGYSMTDPAIMNLLREVKINMGVGGPRHFAILAVNTADQDEAIQRSRMCGSFGVEPIFYPYSDNHEGVGQIIGLLRKATAAAATENEIMEGMRNIRPATSTLIDPDDPQKNRWGGKESDGGFTLSAIVTKARDESSETIRTADGRRLFSIQLTVNGSTPPLTGTVRYHLHPSFVPAVCDIVAVNGLAQLSLIAWGAFTVGVELLDHNVKLELDLSLLPTAPEEFRTS
jgi:hypothetical protein